MILLLTFSVLKAVQVHQCGETPASSQPLSRGISLNRDEQVEHPVLGVASPPDLIE